MALQKLNITIRRGATNVIPIRIESQTWKYAQITGVEQSAPLRVTAVEHGLPDGWRAAMMNLALVGDFAAQNNPPKDSDLRAVVVVDADTVEFNAINGAGFKAYVSGGQLAYREPLNLSPFNGARMDVKEKVGGEPILSFSDGDSLRLDSTTNAVWFEPTIEQSLVLAAKTYVFDIELLRTGGGVEPICSAESQLTVLPEITTTE